MPSRKLSPREGETVIAQLKEIRRKLSEADIEQRKQNAIKYLREFLPHGATVYTVLVHRTRNGVGGVVAVLAVVGGEIRNISGSVSDALVRKWDDRDGVWTNCAFSIVMELSYALHGHKSKNYSENRPHRKATPRRFKAGYSLEHKAL